MDDPAKDVEGVIRNLTQTSPSQQRAAINKYFTPDASFTHPFVRTGSFDNSRALILAIYRWYKIMSPKIELDVHSVSFDQEHLILYALISQTFRIWLVPFYRADVSLVTVLRLTHDRASGKYYIKSQEDLYQVNEFVKFVTWPFGFVLVLLWQFFATALCLLGAAAFWPVTWFEEHQDEIEHEGRGNMDAIRRRVGQGLNDFSDSLEQFKQAPQSQKSK